MTGFFAKKWEDIKKIGWWYALYGFMILVCIVMIVMTFVAAFSESEVPWWGYLIMTIGSAIAVGLLYIHTNKLLFEFEKNAVEELAFKGVVAAAPYVVQGGSVMNDLEAPVYGNDSYTGGDATLFGQEFSADGGAWGGCDKCGMKNCKCDHSGTSYDLRGGRPYTGRSSQVSGGMCDGSYSNYLTDGDNMVAGGMSKDDIKNQLNKMGDELTKLDASMKLSDDDMKLKDAGVTLVGALTGRLKDKVPSKVHDAYKGAKTAFNDVGESVKSVAETFELVKMLIPADKLKDENVILADKAISNTNRAVIAVNGAFNNFVFPFTDPVLLP